MTFKELNFFYELCENPKVSLVAKELNISQSAISIAIKSLENKLGEPLFDRIGKKLVLNERGRYFYEKTHDHYIALLDTQNLFKENGIKGSLKVASSKTVSAFIMPQIYYGFLSKYKEVELQTDTLNSSLIISKVLNGELDIGLIETDCGELDIIKEKLLDDEIIIVTGDEKSEKECYIDSVKKKWLLRESGSGTKEIFFKALQKHAKQIDVFMELHEMQEIKSLLLNHKDTVSAISKVAVAKEIEDKKLFEVKLKNFEFKREFSLIYHKNKTRNKLFCTFKDFIKDSFVTFS
jgi:DNA-binding transcriptional LysR family regulator